MDKPAVVGIKPLPCLWNTRTSRAPPLPQSSSAILLFYSFFSRIYFIDTFSSHCCELCETPPAPHPRLWWAGQFPRLCPAAFSITYIIWIGRLDNKDICTINSPLYHSLPATLTWHTAKPGHRDENGKHKCVPYLQCLTGLLWHRPKSTVRLVSGAERRGGWR